MLRGEMSATEYVNVAEAAQALGVTRRTIWRLISSGRLPAITNPLDHRAKLVRREDVEELARYAGKGETLSGWPGEGEDRRLEPPHDPSERWPWPTTVGAADLGIQSDQVEEWLEANWRPT
jgi:excisionase family DNA binding protein